MQRQHTFRLGGGLDLVSPAVGMPDGHCIAARNYEPLPEGYSRIAGYERYDGRPQPHKATYWTIPFHNGTQEPAFGDHVSINATGSVAVILTVVVESGAFADGTAAGTLVVSELAFVVVPLLFDGDPLLFDGAAMSFTDEFDDALEVDGVQWAESAGVAFLAGALVGEDDLRWRGLAAEWRRTNVAAVPGNGPVRGVHVHDGAVYALRDDGASARLWKATDAGWVAVAPAVHVRFSDGTARFTEGETLTQSGVTATIHRQVTLGGSYEGADATGYLVLTGIAGGNFAAGAASGSGGGAATLLGAQEVAQIAPGGRASFTSHVFGGVDRMFFANGQGRAMEYAGGVLSPIIAIDDPALDRPAHVAQFSNHLFLGYAQGAILHSALGAPLDYRTTAGAGEVNLGSPVTGFVEAASSALMIGGRDKVGYLSGTSAQDFQLVELSSDSGPAPFTMETIGRPIYLDNIGLRGLEATDAFGGFKRGTLTQMVEPLFRLKARQGARAVGAMRVRAKDQYRLFFDDRTGIIVHLGGERVETMPFELPVQAACLGSGEIAQDEYLLLGGDDGFVYRVDVGPSFDGAPVPAFIRLAYSAVGAPYRNKRFHRVTLEMQGGGTTRLRASAEYGYGDERLPPAQEGDLDVSAGGGIWNVAVWDEFFWSAREQGVASVHLNGFGKNVSLAILSDSTDERPHVLTAVTMNYTPRGLVR